MFIINPGAGTVDGATAENAYDNMIRFMGDLIERGIEVQCFNRVPEREVGDGRFCYDLFVLNRVFEIEMPGLPLDQVRYISEDQNILLYPRLYVDGSSWVWKFALSSIEGSFNGGD